MLNPAGEKPAYAQTLSLDDITWGGPQLQVGWRVDHLAFSTALWYETVDFDDLAASYGAEAVDAIAFHIALFEINKGVSFGPTSLHIPERWKALLSPGLLQLWQTVVRRVWAQWRYEHDLPDYSGPAPLHTDLRPVEGLELRLPAATTDNLWFCGGGKDSLLASHMLDTMGEPYESLAYAHSIYGRVAPQIELIDRLVDTSKSAMKHRIYMYDTSTDLPLRELSPYRNARYVLAAETPASLFATLPIALTHGHRNLLLAHERSANVGNLVWGVTGEDVNHQWGKSLEAEALLGAYIKENLIPELNYFSVLQPVHDALIFASLREVSDRIPAAHSCNVAKPWCMRCPKCAYVWICYKAWLPWGPVDETFAATNLLDLEENQMSFRQMLGLEQHTPFECIGQIDETRLAFVLARARGLDGAAMAFIDEVPEFDANAALDRYLAVDRTLHRIPQPLGAAIVAFFEGQAEGARSYAQELISTGRR